MLTLTDIHRFLSDNGITPTDTVLVHTSMKALGEVENGCDGIIDAFKSYLSDGLFIVPTHTWATVTKDNPHYDARESTPCIGALPTVASKRNDGVRSLHPSHSVAVFGKRAVEFVRGEEKATTPCPKGGVWQRLYDENAKILLIGVGLNRNTYIHAVDEMIGTLPKRLHTESFPVTITDLSGKTITSSLRPHGEIGSKFFENYRAPLEELGALKNAKLGNATVGICDAKKTADIIIALWKKAEFDLCDEEKVIPTKYYK